MSDTSNNIIRKIGEFYHYMLGHTTKMYYVQIVFGKDLAKNLNETNLP